MNFEETIKSASGASGLSFAELSRALGMRRNYINGIISKETTPNIYNMARMLKPCGYKLCAVPDDMVDDGMLVITDDRDG